VGAVLFVVALQRFGATGAAMIARPARRGALVRVGPSTGDDLRLAGAPGPGAELFCDGAAWTLRGPGGPVRRARDGDTFVLGHWSILLVFGDDDEADADPDGPSIAVAGDRPLPVPRHGPLLVGAAKWCALRFPSLALPVASVVRADRAGVTLYPLDAVEVRRKRARVRSPVRLENGDAIDFGVSPAVTLVFEDPRAELERLLGTVREEAPRDRLDVSRVEVALWTAGAALALAYLAVAIMRW
jgi:hypothetical protein